MDQNLYEKCIIYIQVHSGEDVKFYSLLSVFLGNYYSFQWEGLLKEKNLCKKNK